VIASSSASREEQAAFTSSVTENSVTLAVEKQGDPKNPGKATGKFALSLESIDNKSPDCVLTIQYVGTMAGTYVVKDLVHYAEGTATARGMPATSAGCTYKMPPEATPQPIPSITWEVSGDGVSMNGSFVITTEGGAKLVWKVAFPAH